MTPHDFLVEDESHFNWALPDGVPAGLGLTPVAAFTGRGSHALEVALATVSRRPRADELRRAWAARYGKAPNPLLLVGAYQDNGNWKASICGPAGDEPPVESNLELGEVERIAAAALAEPSRHAAIRFLASIWSELETELPGLRNQGMFATHDLRDGVPTRGDWQEACARAQAILGYRGRELVERLGFSVETHATAASVLSITGTKRAIAVFLDEGEDFDASADRFAGSSPVSHALALADRESLPWVVLTRGRQIRVYAARAETGVGRKGRSETFVEANLALLPDDRAGYVPLLFSADALKDGGTFDEILEGSRDYSADLGARLRERVYTEAVPSLALALARRHPGELDEEALRQVYEQALTVLFRLLFVAYAEDKDLLPYRSNGAYRDHALKTLARELADRRAQGALVFDQNTTDLWNDVAALWISVDKGNVERGVPPYNGGLFSIDAEVNAAGAALANVRLANAEFGPALAAMLVDESEDGVVGPVDFRSLSVREFGTIYEGLLESSLSIAPSDLALDQKANFVPARDGDEVVVRAGDVYFHNRSGARKASGSYFTKPFAVEHLLDHSLEPALDDHIALINALLDAGEDAKAAQAFFDFRCVDLAMGSGHFLVAAVDRIEARLSALLAQRPIPQLAAELERLRAAAYDALGPLGEGVEIEQSSLLRRQVARRCIYGVDRNVVAVELARLGIWIHTFVPGLPLSFLDHALVEGDSLSGIGTIAEAVQELDPGDDTRISIFQKEITAVLSRAENALSRLARLSDATAAEIKDARAAQAEAAAEISSARDLFDLIVAARLDKTRLPTAFDEASIAKHPDLERVRSIAEELGCLHFPIVFPEVFLRDRTGFNCIIGNPPWEKLHVDEHGFWALRYPGLRGRPVAEQQAAIEKLRADRPDLLAEYEAEVEQSEQMRGLLLRGPYPGLGSGHPDLYKAFAWRFLALVSNAGYVGVVMPRSAMSAAGSALWREAIFDSGRSVEVAMLQNSGGWVFPDVHPQDRFALLSISKRESGPPRATMSGPFTSLARFAASSESASFSADDLRTWSAGAAFPWLPRHDTTQTFERLRASPSLAVFDDDVRFRPVQGDFNATTHADLFDPGGEWPVYKGASFDLWTPDTGIYFGRIEKSVATAALQERRLRQHRLARSAFSEIPPDLVRDPATLPCLSPRIAFSDITNQSNTRTMIVALVPPGVVLTHKAPYLLRTRGDERAEAFLLGVLASIPLDWYTRRFVEKTMTFEIVNRLPIPAVGADDLRRQRIIEIAGTLAARDERFAEWAEAVGVQVSDVHEQRHAELVAELDALVCSLYGLSESDIRVIFETFHEGWDYEGRLRSVLDYCRRLA